MVDTKKLNIYQKLIEVRKSIGKFSRDVSGYGYKYASGTQVLSAIKKEMEDQGVLLETHLLYPTIEKGSKGVIVSSQMKMIWINVDNPSDRSEVEWYMVGEQRDPSQAFGSGLTYSERYFIMKYFNVPTDEDDPDKNKGNDNGNSGKKPSGKGKALTADKMTDPFAGDNADPKSTDKSDKLVTEKQIKLYYVKVKEANVESDKFDKRVKKQFGIEHKNQMTMTQMDMVYKSLDEIIKKNSV